MMVPKERELPKMIEDKDIEKVRNVDWLIDKLNRIDKMSEEERKEVLVGRFTGAGKVSFRGSLFLRTPSASAGGELSFLNDMIGVFEYEADEMGNCSSKTWEWK